jgi:adenosylcobinamide-GDP ribazoletransferase
MTWTFPLALTFLTILPWPRLAPADSDDLVRSLAWFPWVGAILGLAFWGAGLGLTRLLPAPAAAGLVLALSVWLTRGLHLDGLADTADGLLGGSAPEDSLRIMKDSRLGALGGVALTLTLIVKFAFLLAAAQTGLYLAFLIFPVVSRWGMVLLAFLAPYARPEGGLGQAMVAGMNPGLLVWATASAVVLVLGMGRLPGLAALAAGGAAAWLLSLYFSRRLGGITGDTLGAANEILECLTLLVMLLLG